MLNIRLFDDIGLYDSFKSPDKQREMVIQGPLL